VSATLSLPGPSSVLDPGGRRAPSLFGSVRRGEDRGFWRRMLRLLPPVLAAHLVLVAALLTVRPRPLPVPDEPPRVVFLRALPQARAPAAPAQQAHPRPPKARPVAHRREIRPPAVIPRELPPEQPPVESIAAPEAATAVAAATASEAPAHGGSGLGTTGDAPVGIEQITRAPAILFSPRPQYPSTARAMGITGRVLVRVVVDVAGRVEAGSAKVLRSVPGLDTAALAAIVQWRFSGSVDRAGRPVRVILDIPVEFSLR
jgi:protein TonB